MARPKGAENRDKPFRDALRLAINEADGDEKKLRKVARALVTKAMDGDVQAIREIGDRLDGKVAQIVEATHFNGDATDMSDDDLANIAAGRGEGIATPSPDSSQLN